MEEIKNIDKMSDQKLYNLYRNSELTRSEFFVLLACNNVTEYLDSLLLGTGEFKINLDSSVDSELYFTNTHSVLSAFYKLYAKYPNYKLDKILNDWMFNNSHKPGYVYYILHYINLYLDDKKNGYNTFELNNLNEILKNCSLLINKYKTRFMEFKDYEGKNKSNGYLGVFADYNKNFRNELGYDIFDGKSL